jgi:hypothetical protein
MTMLPKSEGRAVKMFNGLNRTVSVARRLDGRINNLHLFDMEVRGVKGDSIHQRASVPEWQDHPDTQLLLVRRDRLLGIQREIAAYDEILGNLGDHVTVEERLEAMKNLANLRMQEERELTAMSDKLDTLRAQSNRHWQMVSKMLTDLAKLKQTDAHFRQRLEFDKQEQSGLTAEERGIIEAVGPIVEEAGDL